MIFRRTRRPQKTLTVMSSNEEARPQAASADAKRTRGVARYIRRILRVPRSIFGLQQAYWPVRRAFPIQQLPPELLADIFMYCLPSEDRALLSVCSAPLSVAAVCKSWRRLALSLPHLWAHFDITLRTAPERDPTVPATAAVGAWVQRSRNTPLSFSLGINAPRIELPDEWGDPVVDTRSVVSLQRICKNALEHQRRWRHVSIDYTVINPDPRGGEKRPIEETLDMVDMPLLEELHLRLSSCGASARVSLSRSPRLRELSLSGEFELGLSSMILENLTSARIDIAEPYYRHLDAPNAISAADFLAIMQKAPNLEQFCAGICGNTFLEAPTDPICLPSLRILRVQFYNVNSMIVRTVLDALTFPALEELGIMIGTYVTGVQSHGFADLLARSSPPLTRLKLHAPSVAAEEICVALRLVPRLTHLVLIDRFCSIPEVTGIITTLLPDGVPDADAGANAVACPVLESLEFGASELRHIYPLFAEMVSLRWGTAGARGSLREIRMREQDTWFVGKDERVKRCLEEGLQIVLTEKFFNPGDRLDPL